MKAYALMLMMAYPEPNAVLSDAVKVATVDQRFESYDKCTDAAAFAMQVSWQAFARWRVAGSDPDVAPRALVGFQCRPTEAQQGEGL